MQDNPLIVALDVDDEVQAIDIIEELAGLVKLYKVGLNLYLSEGDQILNIIKSLDKEIFLDLKLFDIPNTVKDACCQLAKKEVSMITLHTLGGKEMLKAAVDGVRHAETDKPPLLLGVTVLTSFDESFINEQLSSNKSLEEIAVELAILSKKCSLDGIVCSAKEVKAIRKAIGDDLLIITPGIRPKGEDVFDQQRIATPKQALDAGANYIVIGRPIIKAKDKRQATEAIYQEIG